MSAEPRAKPVGSALTSQRSMANPNPEERAGLALIYIGIVAGYVFLLYVWAGNEPNAIAFFAIVITLLIGWGIRSRFAPPRPPPPPPKPAFSKRLAERFKKPPAPTGTPPAGAPAAAPKPAAPPAPPPKKGLFGGLFSPKEPPKK